MQNSKSRKVILNIFSRFFPSQVARLAYKRFTNPQVRNLRANELSILNEAEKNVFSFKTFNIQTYTWFGGADKVLLVHGWEGQAGNFAEFIKPLLNANYTVISFDGPSHGFSSKGKTSLFAFSELVGVMIQRYGISKLISHSFGSVAATYALFKNQGIAIERYALLTTPDKFLERVQDLSEAAGISEKIKNMVIELLEEETKLKADTLNVSDFIKHIKVEQALILHDKDDKIIPISRSQNVYKNWANCSFEAVEGTGHFRILKDKKVINRVIYFLNNN